MTGEIIKVDRLGRVRTKRDQREAMLAEYAGSGMSGVEYAEYIGVKYPTFASWVQKQRREKEAGERQTERLAKPVMEWVEAVVENKPESSSPGGVVIRLRGGEEMTIRDISGVKLAVEMLRQLGGGWTC